MIYGFFYGIITLMMLFLKGTRSLTPAAYIALGAYDIRVPDKLFDSKESLQSEFAVYGLKVIEILEVCMFMFLGAMILYNKNSYRVDSVMSIYSKARMSLMAMGALIVIHAIFFIWFSYELCRDIDAMNTLAL